MTFWQDLARELVNNKDYLESFFRRPRRLTPDFGVEFVCPKCGQLVAFGELIEMREHNHQFIWLHLSCPVCPLCGTIPNSETGCNCK